MRILFYSEKCDFSTKIYQYIERNNLTSHFKLYCVERCTIPQDIKMVPTIIDTDLNQVMEGKLAFDYLLNIKYFNIQTNNIEYQATIPKNPIMKEDKYACVESVGVEIIGPTDTIIQPVIEQHQKPKTNKKMLFYRK